MLCRWKERSTFCINAKADQKKKQLNIIKNNLPNLLAQMI